MPFVSSLPGSRPLLALLSMGAWACADQESVPEPASEAETAPASPQEFGPARPAESWADMSPLEQGFEDDEKSLERLPKWDGPTPKAVILITLDTCRADHFSLYGYERPTSPCLEQFAQSATLYRQAKAAAPWTLPAHATLFTGLYPFEHGARTVAVDEVDADERHNNAVPLAADLTTLAEIFRQQGWETAGIVANVAFLSERFQLNQGFAHYEAERGTADKVNQRFFRWLRKRSPGPFFAFLNYMDAHRPYNVAPREDFPDDGENRQSGELMRELYPLVLMREGPSAAKQKKLERLVYLYDTAIANLDAGLGSVFQRLKHLGLYDDSLIVILGDHGEFLGEHDLLEHSKDVYEGTMGIPLLVKAPGQRNAAEDDGLISQAHIPGLILSYCGFQGNLEGAEGFGRHWPRASIVGENYYSRMHDLRSDWGARFDRVRSVVYDGSFKYIQSTDGAHELYDLSGDPFERRNLLASTEHERERWQSLVRDLMPVSARRRPGSTPQDLSEEDLRVLEELGYVERDPLKKGGAKNKGEPD